MGIYRHSRSTDFVCDICGNFHLEKHGKSWDESGAASALVIQDGWHISKGKVLCPRCNADTGYSIEDVLR
jgi:transposase-like protein